MRVKVRAGQGISVEDIEDQLIAKKAEIIPSILCTTDQSGSIEQEQLSLPMNIKPVRRTYQCLEELEI